MHSNYEYSEIYLVGSLIQLISIDQIGKLRNYSGSDYNGSDWLTNVSFIYL